MGRSRMLLDPLEIATRRKAELVDITGRVESALRSAGVRTGVVFVISPHTTAGITIQENADPDVREDLLLALETAAGNDAVRGRYRHAEGNSDAHVKTSLVGTSQMVPIEDGKLVLGTWQGIYLCEFDGPRNRKVLLKVMPG